MTDTVKNFIFRFYIWNPLCKEFQGYIGHMIWLCHIVYMAYIVKVDISRRSVENSNLDPFLSSSFCSLKLSSYIWWYARQVTKAPSCSLVKLSFKVDWFKSEMDWTWFWITSSSEYHVIWDAGTPPVDLQIAKTVGLFSRASHAFLLIFTGPEQKPFLKSATRFWLNSLEDLSD